LTDEKSGRLPAVFSVVPNLQMQIRCLLPKVDVFKRKKICSSKTWQIFFRLNPLAGFALDVESGRVELPSKQGTKRLSTRLADD